MVAYCEETHCHHAVQAKLFVILVLWPFFESTCLAPVWLDWTPQHRGHSRGPSSSWIGTKLHNDPCLAQMSGWMLQCFMGVTLKASVGQGLFFARNRRAELKAPVRQPSSHCIGTKLHRDPPLDQTNGRMPQCLTEITLKVSLGQGLSFFVESLGSSNHRAIQSGPAVAGLGPNCTGALPLTTPGV